MPSRIDQVCPQHAQVIRSVKVATRVLSCGLNQLQAKRVQYWDIKQQCAANKSQGFMFVIDFNVMF